MSEKQSGGPLISVVVPTYNHAKFLGRAIRSVIEQTYGNWEMIIVDNHSTDNTQDVIAGFGEHRIRSLMIHNNGIIAASRNKGMRHAKGEWLAFLDSDDVWYPEKLRTIVDQMEKHPEAKVFSVNEMQIDNSSGRRSVLKHGPYTHDFYRTLLVTGNRLSTSATVVETKLVQDNGIYFRENKEFVTAEDYDFWMLLARTGAVFKFTESVQGEYVIHAANSSGQRERHQTNINNVLNDHVFNVQTFDADKSRLLGLIRSQRLTAETLQLLRAKEIRRALSTLGEAFRLSATGPAAYLVSRLNRRYL